MVCAIPFTFTTFMHVQLGLLVEAKTQPLCVNAEVRLYKLHTQTTEVTIIIIPLVWNVKHKQTHNKRARESHTYTLFDHTHTHTHCVTVWHTSGASAAKRCAVSAEGMGVSAVDVTEQARTESQVFWLLKVMQSTRNCVIYEYHTHTHTHCVGLNSAVIVWRRKRGDTEACDQMKWTLFGLLPTFSSRLAGYLIEVWLSATRTHTFVLVKLHNTHMSTKCRFTSSFFRATRN